MIEVSTKDRIDMGEKGYFDDPKWDQRLKDETLRVQTATALGLPRAATWEEITAAFPKDKDEIAIIIEKIGTSPIIADLNRLLKAS